MKRKKFQNVREELIAFLDEIIHCEAVPFTLKQKALDLKARVLESGTRGVGSRLSLDQQMKVFFGDAEANRYPLVERAKQKIRKRVAERIGLDETNRSKRRRTK